MELAPQHLSCYQLTIHEGTRFGVQAKHGLLSELPEDDQATLFELTHRFLADAGWPAYEVSNFARGPAHQSRHNRKYWDHTPYLGLGPSAHSLARPGRCLAGPPLVERARHAALGETARGRRASDRGAGAPGSEGPGGGGAAARPAHHGRDRPRPASGRATASTCWPRTTALVARLVDEGRIVVRADAEGGRWLVPTLSGLAVADGLAAAFDLSLPNWTAFGRR